MALKASNIQARDSEENRGFAISTNERTLEDSRLPLYRVESGVLLK